jgi:hypothetical protein
LKGNFIWSQDDPDLFLDGETFGTPRGDGTTALRPRPDGMLSGENRRGGDFEMWFWLVNELGDGRFSFRVTPSAISFGGIPASGRVTLIGDPGGQVEVKYAADPEVVEFTPESAPILPGFSSTPVTITPSVPLEEAQGVNITATVSFPDGTEEARTVDLRIDPQQ